MSYTNRELLQNALKRVNALAGTNASIKKNDCGWYVIQSNDDDKVLFSCETMKATELLAYLHGIEDALKFNK